MFLRKTANWNKNSSQAVIEDVFPELGSLFVDLNIM
jgi:hypothetical protein